jgi:polyvinyl alcohol dehydrogenase (cytochrome)
MAKGVKQMWWRIARCACVICVASMIGTTAEAAAAAQPDGAALYHEHCAKCHDQSLPHVPTRDSLSGRSASNIVMTLKTGAMKPQAADLSLSQVNAIVGFLTAGAARADSLLRPNLCRAPVAAVHATATDWNGWGRDLANSRFQDSGGISPAALPHLKIKWAYAYPGAMTWGQPTVVGGRVFVASTTGQVIALDAATGCTVWNIKVGAPVRTAISVAPSAGGRTIAYFGDTAATAHAVDADTGKELWHTHLDQHAFARVTGAPVLLGNRLLVPISSYEEGAASQNGYSCCTFRGSLVALDADSGRIAWKHRTIPIKPHAYHRKGDATELFGPAGASVWGAPTIDPARGVVYIGTGNDYTDIRSPMTDAIMALSLETGHVVWVQQLLRHDDWESGCSLSGPCPESAGPDADFSVSPILVKLPSGGQVLVAGQKSGMVFGLDPAAGGKVLWKTRVGAGGVFGGIEWGMAAIGSTVFVPISDNLPSRPTDTPRPGLGALDAATGKVLWWSPAPMPVCGWGTDDCHPALSQAVTAMDGIVLSGSQDGHLRAFDAHTGKIVSDFDTGRPVVPVNAPSASGGSLDSGGPAVADGTIYVNSGYGQFLGHGGNVLLALSPL